MSYSFDATQVAPDAGQLGPVPAGWYKVTISKTNIKPTKAGTGLMLEIMFSVAQGTLKNRAIFGRYNIENPNAQTVEIARGQISAICHATGLMSFQDPNQLVGGPLQIRVAVTHPEGYEPQNEIKAYKAMSEVIDGEFPGLDGAATGAAPAGAPAAPGAPAPGAPVQQQAAQQPVQQQQQQAVQQPATVQQQQPQQTEQFVQQEQNTAANWQGDQSAAQPANAAAADDDTPPWMKPQQ